MKIKKILAAVLAVVMLFSLCACNSGAIKDAIKGEQTSTGEEITVTDMIGREVKVVPGSYKRVVCVGAGALRMYCYVCDVSLLCGVEDIDNTTAEGRPMMFDAAARPYVLAYGDLFNTLPSCGVGGPMAQAAEAEKILECEPDIVISLFQDVEKEDALQEQLGVPVITLVSGEGVFDQIFLDSLTLLGKIFSAEDRATTIINFINEEKADIATRIAGITEKPNVYICGLGNWGTADHLMTSENYAPFQVAGIQNAVSGLGIGKIGPIEEEKFVAIGADMDIMIIDAAAVKNMKPLYAEDPTMFDTCKAWQNGEVYLEMAYNAYYTNYEIALANTWFAAMTVYPEAFSDVDITEKLNEITRMFLGQDLAGQIYACPASFGGYQKIDTATFFN